MLATTLVLVAALLHAAWNTLIKFSAERLLVIACMAGQAIGRAAVMGDVASRWVAVGAGFFMVSDALLATNRFVTPLPMAPLWVLGTYYAAQVLIVRHTRPAAA